MGTGGGLEGERVKMNATEPIAATNDGMAMEQQTANARNIFKNLN